MRTDIRFAGLALNWTSQYATAYCDKMIEMGFYCKVLDFDTVIVAYSPLPFSRQEAMESFSRFPEGYSTSDTE